MTPPTDNRRPTPVPPAQARRRIPTDAREIDQVRADLLRFFLASAKQTNELWAEPALAAYPKAWLRKRIYALELAGLLEKWGQTSGAWYHTTHLGYIVLASLDENLSDKGNRRLSSALD